MDILNIQMFAVILENYLNVSEIEEGKGRKLPPFPKKKISAISAATISIPLCSIQNYIIPPIIL